MTTIDMTDLDTITGGIVAPPEPETPSAPGNPGDYAKTRPPIDNLPNLSDVIRQRDWYPTTR
jgi:hypothetical protein